MAKYGVVTGEILANKLPSESLYAIKSHDYRAGFQPKSRLDNALKIADTLERIIDRVTTRGNKCPEVRRRDREDFSGEALV
jgi:hypothetical protein